MAPILLSLTLFAAWWLIGVGLLLAVRADLTSLRLVLAAPALGSAITVLPLFVASSAGVAMQYAGPVVGAALLLGSVVLIVMRRPTLPRGTAPVIAACVGGAFLTAWPFFDFGFSWIANTNGDMTLYVLSAVRLLHHGLLSVVHPSALANDRDFAGLTGNLYEHGGRPGTDITLAALSAATGRAAYQMYMPLGVALNLVGASSVAALAMQAARRRWAAIVAAIIFVLSPLATYALVQQLVPQVWGLALATALLALLLRPELHQAGGARISTVVPIGVIAAALVVVYVEVVSTLALAYALYVFVLICSRQLAPKATVIRLWAPALAIILLALNSYSFRDVAYVKLQVEHGTHSAFHPPLFGYALVPSALSAVFGLQEWNASSTSQIVGLSIVAAALILAVVLLAVGATFWRGQAASIALAASAFLAVVLIHQVSDFGLFKLGMFIQPFLAAAIAVWLAMLGRRYLIPVAALVALLVMAQLSVQLRYMQHSRNPIDLRDASSPTLVQAFQRFFPRTAKPVVTVADNLVLAKLEASVVGQKPLYFISDNIFSAKWRKRTFKLLDSSGQTAVFEDNENASALLSNGDCDLVLPTGSQNITNRRALPQGSPDLVFRSCDAVRNKLVFTASNHGLGFYDFYRSTDRRDVSFFQLEPDYFYPGKTFSGIGRYLLFRVLGPEPHARLELWITTTVRAPNANQLPPAGAVGARRATFPIVGRGSARVFSAPLEPQMIGGQPYVMLDLGRDGTLSPTKRAAIQGLFGKSVITDPRFLTAYVRNISLVGPGAYRSLVAPSSVSTFPKDLSNENLEYSGIYEDGWVAGDSYVVLAAGPAGTLSLQAEALPVVGQHLDVLVNGRNVVSQSVAPGPLTIHVPLAASTLRRKVVLRWAHTTQLSSADRRQAAARLEFLGVPEPPSALTLPRDLADPDISVAGFFKDGWSRRNARVVLAGGSAGKLSLRGQVVTGSQRVEVIVDGRTVASRAVKPGDFDLQAPIPAATTARTIELRWANSARIAANDPRQAAARLTFVGVVPVRGPKLVRIPSDLTMPGLSYAGIYADGWAEKDVRIVLAGGRRATLKVTAMTVLTGQRVAVVVDGRTIANRNLKPGSTTLPIPLSATTVPRDVELHFSRLARIAANDPRLAATLLRTIAVGDR